MSSQISKVGLEVISVIENMCLQHRFQYFRGHICKERRKRSERKEEEEKRRAEGAKRKEKGKKENKGEELAVNYTTQKQHDMLT